MLEPIVSIFSLSEKMIDEFKEQNPKPSDELIGKLEQIRIREFEKDNTTWYQSWEEVKKILKQEITNDYQICKAQFSKQCERALRQNIPQEPKDNDFTFYLEEPDLQALFELLQNSSVEIEQNHTSDVALQFYLRRRTLQAAANKLFETANKFSYEQELWLWDGTKAIAMKGRVLACRCEKGRRWSVTFRKKDKYPDSKPADDYLNEFAEINKLLCKAIGVSDNSELHGLVVITGRTGSGKSEIANKFIEAYLNRQQSRSRNLHLLTFEDPIEKLLDEARIKKLFSKVTVDYTPREKGKDVGDLREAINNALRQTPALMFVGETRDPEDWNLLLEFAGTGHLVVTTAHAGSLTEAMENILQAAKAHDPMTRSLVGERLLALIHLKPHTVEISENSKVGVLIPVLWHSTPQGIKALMAEGLASLLPNTPKELCKLSQNEALPSSIGRYWFARELFKKSEIVKILEELADLPLNEVEELNTPKKIKEDMKRKINSKSCEWDLQGI